MPTPVPPYTVIAALKPSKHGWAGDLHMPEGTLPISIHRNPRQAVTGQPSHWIRDRRANVSLGVLYPVAERKWVGCLNTVQPLALMFYWNKQRLIIQTDRHEYPRPQFPVTLRWVPWPEGRWFQIDYQGK